MRNVSSSFDLTVVWFLKCYTIDDAYKFGLNLYRFENHLSRSVLNETLSSIRTYIQLDDVCLKTI